MGLLRVATALGRSAPSARTAPSAVRCISTAKNRQTLGSYPVPPENYIWWKNRWQVPGGEIRQQVSPFQLKIMWQYFYNNPSKWYWRFSNWMWPVLMPAFMFYVLWQKVKADAEEEVRLHSWY